MSRNDLALCCRFLGSLNQPLPHMHVLVSLLLVHSAQSTALFYPEQWKCGNGLQSHLVFLCLLLLLSQEGIEDGRHVPCS